MNPVTRRLLDDIDDPALADFALAWDAYEEALIRLFRDPPQSPPEAERFEELRRSLADRLPGWERELEPHWQATFIQGAHPDVSPFETALHVQGAQVAGNWTVLRALPAAREALNTLLLERAVESDAASD